jgi:hypothetical protein
MFEPRGLIKRFTEALLHPSHNRDSGIPQPKLFSDLLFSVINFKLLMQSLL